MSPELGIILVVEDDAPLRSVYRTALRMAGFFVNEAANGLEALRALDADPPDLVVLDLGLPIVSDTRFGPKSLHSAIRATFRSLLSPDQSPIRRSMFLVFCVNLSPQRYLLQR
jgi:CheY-like chemotaxis protein